MRQLLIDKKRKTSVKYEDENHPACVKANKLVSNEIRKARKDFERKLAIDIKFDKKPFFAYAKSKAKFTVSAGPLIDSSGSILQTPEENTEEFNRFFLYQYLPRRILRIYLQGQLMDLRMGVC